MRAPPVQYDVPNPPFPGGSTPFFASADGNQLPYTPQWTADAGLSYLMPTSIGDWTLDALYFHNSGWFGEADNQLRQPAYDNVNTALHWRVNNGPYTVSLWCRNATNSLEYTSWRVISLRASRNMQRRARTAYNSASNCREMAASARQHL
jgi:hypothetical protein